MNKKLTTEKIYSRYQKDVSYKTRLDLYNKVKQQENFFLSKQWEGVNAPDLPKPTLNFIKRVVNYLISVLVVDDIGIAYKGYDPLVQHPVVIPHINKRFVSEEEMVEIEAAYAAAAEKPQIIEEILPAEVDRINENVKFGAKLRRIVHNMAVDGDACLYVRYDPDKGVQSDEQTTGEIETEIVDNTNVHFGDVMTNEVEKQPYIIISKLKLTEELRRQYPDLKDEIKADNDENDLVPEDSEEEVTTVLTYMYKKDGKVWFCECTRDVFLVEPVNTEQTLYPVAYTSWEFVKNQYHGVGAVEEAIPNQIEVNKLWAMALLFQKNNAFSITLYDKTKIERWVPKVGAVIGVIGNPNEAIASSFKAHDMSSQVVQLVERTINLTKEFMGANDAVLGNINPQNTSAIVAVQKASAAPLELQKLSLYQFIEDYIRIVVDIIRCKYGIREVSGSNGQQLVDFSQLEYNKNFNVDIGASAYYSENAQIETMNNLWAAGIIKDAKLLVESMPDKFVPNKNKILQHLEEYEQQQQQLMAQQMATAQGGM